LQNSTKKEQKLMNRKSIFLAAILAALVYVLCPGVNAQTFAVGSTVENFNLTDINGKEQSFESLKGEKGTIIVFLSAQCPVVKAYNDRLNQIANDYKAKGINFIGINSNSTESLDWVKSHAEEHYKFPMLIDKGNVIADKFGASATPEIFLFDTKNKLVYHGAIDNDRNGEKVTENYLRTALDETLGGKTVSKNETRAVGCTIKKVQK
jgi:peroxiredoxin